MSASFCRNRCCVCTVPLSLWSNILCPITLGVLLKSELPDYNLKWMTESTNTATSLPKQIHSERVSTWKDQEAVEKRQNARDRKSISQHLGDAMGRIILMINGGGTGNTEWQRWWNKKIVAAKMLELCGGWRRKKIIGRYEICKMISLFWICCIPSSSVCFLYLLYSRIEWVKMIQGCVNLCIVLES